MKYFSRNISFKINSSHKMSKKTVKQIKNKSSQQPQVQSQPQHEQVSIPALLSLMQTQQSMMQMILQTMQTQPQSQPQPQTRPLVLQTSFPVQPVQTKAVTEIEDESDCESNCDYSESEDESDDDVKEAVSIHPEEVNKKITSINTASSKVFIICRVSTHEQADGESINGQESSCMIINKRLFGPKNPTIKRVECSAFKSIFDDGKLDTKNELGKMFSSILKLGKKPVIIVRTADRFSRNLADAKRLLQLLEHKDRQGRVIFGRVNDDKSLTWHSTENAEGRKLFLQLVQAGQENSKNQGLASLTGRFQAQRKRKLQQEQMTGQDLLDQAESDKQEKIDALVLSLRKDYDETRILKSIISLYRDCKKSNMTISQFNQRFSQLIDWDYWPAYIHNRESPLVYFYDTVTTLTPQNTTLAWYADLLASWKIKIPVVPNGFKHTKKDPSWELWDEEILGQLLNTSSSMTSLSSSLQRVVTTSDDFEPQVRSSKKQKNKK